MTLPKYMKFYYDFNNLEAGCVLAWGANLADARRRVSDVLDDKLGELTQKFDTSRGSSLGFMTYDNLYEYFNRFNTMQDRDERLCGWQHYTRLNFIFSSMESGALRHYAQLAHSLKGRHVGR